MKPAASVIVPIRRPAGEIAVVGITRDHDMHDVSAPGGTAEESDPTPAHTASRELLEESGIVVRPEDLDALVVRPDGGHVMYLARNVVCFPSHLRSEPFEGYVGLYPPCAFLTPRCRHRATHEQAFSKLGIR